MLYYNHDMKTIPQISKDILWKRYHFTPEGSERYMANSTMADVAREAGVALTTVGRVLNGGYVSEEKREKVNAAIRKLGYVPNKMARSLKASESKLIGVFLRFNPNQLYAHIANGLTRAIEAAGYNSYIITSYDRRYENQIDEFISRKVDGLMIVSMADVGEKVVEKVQNAGIPVVMIERCLDMPKVDRVVINDFDGAKEAVNSLIDYGCRDIAYVGMKPNHSVEQERYDGYVKALLESGFEQKPGLVKMTESYTMEAGFEAAKQLVESGTKVDAAFCTADTLAAGFMQYLYTKNIRVPDEIRLTGYDDVIAKLLSPQISSVSLNYDLIGEKAMKLMLYRIKNPQLEAREIRTDTKFNKR